MDHLAHPGRPIYQEVVENPGLYGKASGARPLRVLGLEGAMSGFDEAKEGVRDTSVIQQRAGEGE